MHRLRARCAWLAACWGLLLGLSLAAGLPGGGQPAFAQQAPKPLVWFPILFYTPESKVAVGLFLLRNYGLGAQGRPSNVRIFFVLTQTGQRFVAVYPTLYLGTRGILRLAYTHSESPSARYFGLGEDTQHQVYQEYASLAQTVSANPALRLFGQLYLGVEAKRQRRELSDLMPPTSEDVALEADLGQEDLRTLLPEEAQRNTILYERSGQLFWDSRDKTALPSTGSLISYSRSQVYSTEGRPPAAESPAGQASQAPPPRYEFSRQTLDARTYLPLGQRINLALQLLERATSLDDDVPFYALPQLGGSRVLRGYFEGRFRARAIRVAQTEVRFWGKRWGGAVFTARGWAAPSRSALSEAMAKPASGGAVYYFLDPGERTSLRGDVARAEGENSFYVQFSHPF